MKKSILLFVLLPLIISFSCNRRKKQDAPTTLPYKIVHQEKKVLDSLYFQLDIQNPLFVANNSNEVDLHDLNNAIQQFLDSAMVYFWGTDTAGARKMIDETGASGYFMLLNNYEIKDTSAKVISLKFETYSYALGAHGFTAFTTFNFDVPERKFIQLTDLIDVSEPEKMLAMDSLLIKYLDDPEDCFTTEPFADENFNRFTISSEYLSFFFEAYELGAYSCGSAEIRIPIAELKSADLWLLKE